MYQYNQNKIDGLGTWPEFEKDMNFYVPVGVILVVLQLEDCSDCETGIESKTSSACITRQNFCQIQTPLQTRTRTILCTRTSVFRFNNWEFEVKSKHMTKTKYAIVTIEQFYH